MGQVKLCQAVAAYRKSKNMGNEKVRRIQGKMDHIAKAKGGNHFQDCRDYECLHTLGQKALSPIQIHRSRQDRLSCPMGRPENSLPGRREHSAVPAARTEDHLGAVRLHGIIRDSTGINIPYNKIHPILRDENLASEHPKKSKRCKWARFERYLFELYVAHRLQAARRRQMVPVL